VVLENLVVERKNISATIFKAIKALESSFLFFIRLNHFT